MSSMSSTVFNNIARLAATVSHQISTANVILDPAAVVKELVENSLDAQATNIDVHVQGPAGLKVIRVTDNGLGMSPEDLPNACLPHTTSKLKSLPPELLDSNKILSTVRTLGFRGEALAAITALSARVEIITRNHTMQTATRAIYSREGKLLESGPAPGRQGTTVEVHGFLESYPVRRQNAEKNARKELSKIVSLLQSYALINVHCRLSAEAQSSTLVLTKLNKFDPVVERMTPEQVPSHQSHISIQKTDILVPQFLMALKENISTVFGIKQATSLLQLDAVFDLSKANTSNYRLIGYLSKTETGSARSLSDRQYFYLNSRPVDIPKLAKAITESFRKHVPHKFPMFVLLLTAPEDSYDVNVTPDKRVVLLHHEDTIVQRMVENLDKLWGVEAEREILVTQSQKVTAAEAGVKRDYCGNVRSYKLNLEAAIESSDHALNDPSRTNRMIPKDAPDTSDIDDDQEQNMNEEKRRRNEGETEKEKDAAAPSPTGEKESMLKRENSRIMKQKDRLDLLDRIIKKGNSKIFALQKDKTDLKNSTTVEEHSMRVTERDNVSFLANPNKTDFLDAQAVKTSRAEMQASNSRDDDDFDIPQKESSLKRTLPLQQQQQSTNGNANLGKSRQKLLQMGAKSRKSITDFISQRGQVHRNRKQALSSDREEDDDIEIMQKYKHSIHDDDDHRHHLPILPKRNHDQRSKNNEHYVSDDPKKKMRNFAEVKEWMSKSSYVYSCSLEQIRQHLQARKKQQHCVIVGRDETNVGGHEFFSKSNKFECATLQNSNIISDKQDESAAEEELSRVFKKAWFQDMKIIGQFNLGFIIVSLDHDLFILDQHAADEKRNFERLYSNHKIQAQKLVCPVSLRLSAEEELVAIEHLSLLRKSGFEISHEPLLPPTQKLKLVSVPHMKGVTFGVEDVEQMVGYLLEHGNTSGLMRNSHQEESIGSILPPRIRGIFASRACRMSIMIGTALSVKTMNEVVKGLSNLRHPWSCPHGRPTMRHLYRLETRASPRPSPRASPRPSPRANPRASPRANPSAGPSV